MAEEKPVQLNKLQSGTQFKQYHMLEKIGVGGQGVVWSALDQANDRIVAVKFMDPFLDDETRIEDWVMDHQIAHLLKLQHPNILPLFDYGLSGSVRYMVSAYISGGSLSRWLKSGRYSTEQASKCAAAIASGLEYLHNQGIIHRDLKPGNILMDFNLHPYLTDFGLARDIATTTRVMHTGRGTPPYAPPEQHKMTQITQASDIYSFGVMLYELFTRQLPWGGEQFLASLQLQSNAELPDPCEIDPTLPPSLADVLRRMTAAEPAARLATMTQVRQMLGDCFGTPFDSESIQPQSSQADIESADAVELFKQTLAAWHQNNKSISTSLTLFALIDRFLRREGTKSLPPEIQHFMLQHALTYGYNHDLWWKQVPEPGRRIGITADLLGIQREEIAARTVNILLKDEELRSRVGGLPESMVASLLETAGRSNDPWLRQECLEALLALTPPAMEWRQVALGTGQDEALAGLAVEESEHGDKAAQLIGHLQSRTATQKLIQLANADRRTAALQVIQKEAGSLPSTTELNVRLGISMDWIISQLFARPLNLLAAYATAFLGSVLGFGLLFYLSYRLPEYLDMLRISTSLVRALILGIPFGLGILVSRLVAERFSKVRPLLRMGLAAVIGGLVMMLAVYIHHVLILNTPPKGFLIAGGCLLTALGFSLGALKKSRLWKMAVSLVASLAALAGTWWIHNTIGGAAQTPMLPFDASTTVIQLLGMVFAAALLTAVLGNSVNLTLPEE